MSPVLWTLLVVVLAVAAVGVGVFVLPYNAFVRQRNVIQESWRQVDVELNRRYELIPALVEVVRAAVSDERGRVEQISRLRDEAMQLSGGEAPAVADPRRAAVEQELTSAVHGLVRTAEDSEHLRGNQNFLELQRQLAETEDRIAAGRRFYNANVRAYNTRIEQVPSNVVANIFRFHKATYFEVKDPAVRQAPGIDAAQLDAARLDAARLDTVGQDPQLGR